MWRWVWTHYGRKPTALVSIVEHQSKQMSGEIDESTTAEETAGDVRQAGIFLHRPTARASPDDGPVP